MRRRRARQAGKARCLVEVSPNGRRWQPIKVPDADELKLRQIKGDWHSGYATMAALDGRDRVHIRFRLEGETGRFCVDDIRVIAADATAARPQQENQHGS